MKITIHRGTHEIGGTLIELQSSQTRILLDAGYPLFLNGNPIDDSLDKQSEQELLKLGVLPPIEGLYNWDNKSFDAIIISHAHIDHYGLLRFVHRDIPIYLSAGTKRLIEISQIFEICPTYPINSREFTMYTPFAIGDFEIKPYLMDHSAFDAAAFEISADGKTVIYSGDFRGHGRKAVCLESFIRKATKQADILLSEGTMFGRANEKIITEAELEDAIVNKMSSHNGITLFQSSSQNIDRIVTFYRAALRLNKIFAVDVYTANVLYELRSLGNSLPYPSDEYKNIKVFFPYRLTQKIFRQIGETYAKQFSPFYISKGEIKTKQNDVVMAVRPSMLPDLKKCELSKGLFIYSLWQGYRESEYQQKFEKYLSDVGFAISAFHTSGHASVNDIERLINGLQARRLIPIHTMFPDAFEGVAPNAEVMKDGVTFEI